MDDLVVLLIMVVIGGIVALANKIKEIKESQQKGPPTVRREDLPERTRQMLYGGEVKMAKPKQGQPYQPQQQRTPPPAPHAQREAAPRALPTAPQRRTVVAKRPAPPPPVVAEEMSPRELQALREEQAQPHTHEPGHDWTPHELRALREQQEAAERARRQPKPRSPREAKAQREQRQLAEQRNRVVQQTRQMQQEAQQQAHGKRRQAPIAPAAQRRRRLLETGDDVRRGIVLAEILGPPKAFE